MTTSVSIVGRAQFMAGIVQLASVNTTGLGKLLGYFNSIFGGGAMIYTFLIDTLNGTLAQKLSELVLYAQMSALGSGLIGLLLFISSTSGSTPTVYTSLAKLVNYYADLVALVFGTLHTLTYF